MRDVSVSARTFYRWSLALPLVVPALVVLLFDVFPSPPAGPATRMLAFVAVSPILGGVPYAALAIWGLFWIDHRPEVEIRRRAWVVPLLMIPAYGLQEAMLTAIGGGGAPDAFAMFLFGARVILVLGYVYVLMVFGLRVLLFGRTRGQAA